MKRRLTALLFLLSLMVGFFVFEPSQFAPLNVKAQGVEPISGNITFQPNSIPSVNVYYQDYSFVFEYKSYFIRVRPFVIYNGTYYGMKRIVQWIKTNYPNVNYTWLVDKAVNAIHYGFNLTKLPQNVANKIDYLGFRLIDYNFPLSWFEIETYLHQPEIELPYNITIIKIPKANLEFSFEDLYSYGYSVEHINSTYILIGGVKSKQNLFCDPITFSSNTIIVTGFTEGTPATFWDLWNASDVNGWDVVQNNNGSNVQYEFDCRIQIGDGSIATYFGDAGVQVTFSTVPTGGQALVNIKANAEMRLGELLDSTMKTVQKGVSIISKQTVAGYIIMAWSNSNGFYLYDSLIVTEKATIGQKLLIYANNMKVYGSRLDNSGIVGFINAPSGTHDIYRVDVKRSQIALQRIWGTINDIFVYNTTYAYWFGGTQGSDTLRNFKARNNTYAFLTQTGIDRYIINADIDNWNFWYSGVPTNEIYRQYEFDLTIYFKNGTQTQNANVTITNDYLGTSDSWLTFANGSIPMQTYSYGHYNQTGGDTIYDYNPYNLTVTLNGYETYTDLINITQKENLRIALLEEAEAQPTPEGAAGPIYYLLQTKILDFQGIALTNIKVTVYRTDETVVAEDYTNEGGLVTFNLQPDYYRIVAVWNNQTVSSHWLRHDRQGELTLQYNLLTAPLAWFARNAPIVAIVIILVIALVYLVTRKERKQYKQVPTLPR